jgi:glycosyltransferase involved in cell wall biosynthesis
MHVPEKGIDRMLRAIAECRNRGIELRLRIAGCETSLSRDLLRLREELQVAQNVKFLGSIPHEQILQEMRQADLILACPRVVVFDLSLLEAMAAGRPILTTRLAGNVEALGPDYPGYFANDEELAPTLIRILGESALLDRMGRMNKARFEKEFTLEAMGDRHLSMYSSILHDLAPKSDNQQVGTEVMSS